MLAALALPSIMFAAPQKHSAPRAVSSSLPAPVKSFGSPSAPIKLEVFSDFQCPSCRNFYEATLRPMIADYVAQGKVYLVNHDFPLQMHKYSGDAARWANAAAMIGQFGEVEGTLFDHQDAWEADGNIEKFVSQALSPSELKRVEEILENLHRARADFALRWHAPAAGSWLCGRSLHCARHSTRHPDSS